LYPKPRTAPLSRAAPRTHPGQRPALGAGAGLRLPGLGAAGAPRCGAARPRAVCRERAAVPECCGLHLVAPRAGGNPPLNRAWKSVPSASRCSPCSAARFPHAAGGLVLNENATCACECGCWLLPRRAGVQQHTPLLVTAVAPRFLWR